MTERTTAALLSILCSTGLIVFLIVALWPAQAPLQAEPGTKTKPADETVTKTTGVAIFGLG